MQCRMAQSRRNRHTLLLLMPPLMLLLHALGMCKATDMNMPMPMPMPPTQTPTPTPTPMPMPPQAGAAPPMTMPMPPQAGAAPPMTMPMPMPMPPTAAPPFITKHLTKYMDELPRMPRIRGYRLVHGMAKPAELRIGMYRKKWKFHRQLPPSTVFAYGTSEAAATVPGPTIEAQQGVETRVRWENHLPRHHILPWDRTLPSAVSRHGGVPTVVHLHGAVADPQSDGFPTAWFTAGFNETGPAWALRTYRYPNVQQPGNLWYHDHALGLTRVNILAGLAGAYIIRNASAETHLRLPRGRSRDRVLMISDKTFNMNGSIFINSTGVDPSVHPEWQPEYVGDTMTVNGKAWPFLEVKRRKYRFRIINACNSRFIELGLSDENMTMMQIGADSAYLRRPVKTKSLLLSPSEIADIVIDFRGSNHSEILLTNSAPSIYPSGPMSGSSMAMDPMAGTGSSMAQLMKFIVAKQRVDDRSNVPSQLLAYPEPDERSAVRKRNIALFMYMNNKTMATTSMLINAAKFRDPVTEIAKQGTDEIWDFINLDMESHPMHVHLANGRVLRRTQLIDVDNFTECMMMKNDAVMCGLDKHAVGRVSYPLPTERGWKNVFRTDPGYVTRVFMRFSLLDSPGTAYPFNASAFPGYVYHCHMLEHEDNEMMRPLLVVS